MKANEFVKKFGLVKSRDVVKNAPKDDCSYSIEIGIYLDRYAFSKYEVYIDEIKRLVESWDLVELCGGLKLAKRILKKAYTQFNTMVSVVWNDKPFQCTIQKLEQAIADVESCQ